MTQAYHNLGIYNVPVVITNLYVRFKPTTPDQLSVLDSTMELQGLELFDTPFDYDITYEGDYYQDPSIPEEQITWQYAVVPPSYVPPAGIQYEVLAQIHIPDNNYTAVETEAENLASGGGSALIAANGIIQPNVPLCADGFHWNAAQNACVPNNCPVGYHWSGSGCVVDQVAPPTPPGPAADAAVPSGTITVNDTQVTNPASGNVPVRKARIIAKRWFKIEWVYTDNNGHFQCTKRFKHLVKINIKFKNPDAQIRTIRGIRIWQILLPIKMTIGKFSSDKTAANYNFTKYPDYSAKGNMYWTAATVHNGVQEYREYTPVEHTALPPQGLKIYISKLGIIGNAGASPMFNIRYNDNLTVQFASTYLSPVPAVIFYIIHQFDIVIGYRYTDINSLLSDHVKETVYHALTHAAQYNQLGNTWYSNFVNSEIIEVASTFTSTYKPYGPGTDTYGPIIGLGESWAYYLGHYFSNKKYGLSSSNFYEQGKTYTNNSPLSGFGSHPNLLEDFDPNYITDPLKWIPQGLYYDLNDNRNDRTFNLNAIIDQVSGFTNQQMYNAFNASITTLQACRSNLILLNPNNQTAQVTSLFSKYGY